MIEKNTCPLCASSPAKDFSRDSRRIFLQCPVCGLVFVPASQHLPEREEKQRYDLHENDPADNGYCRYLGRLLEPLLSRLSPASEGLDFGSGPSPVLSRMLQEAGHRVVLYDRYYHDDCAAFDQQYDFITASEVVEHLREPRIELDRIWACLRPNGILAIMTQFLVDRSEFQRWHYKNDATHIRFFAPGTFAWLADKWHAELTIPEKDVVLLTKPAS